MSGPAVVVGSLDRARPRRSAWSFDWSAWRPTWSKAAALRALRATIVIPGVFALTDKVIGNLQMATFAAFGGFATLVLASFGGGRREKAVAHFGLALVGSVLIVIGTAVNSSTALAAIVTVPVAFAVFFSGIAGPNAAGGVTGALLAYVLPASSRGTAAMIPSRLEGWWLASAASAIAVLVLSPRPPGDQLRASAAALARTVAHQLRAGLLGEANPGDGLASIDAKEKLVTAFTSTPYRPIGLTTADQALANVVQLLEWCTALVRDCLQDCTHLRTAPATDRELLLLAVSLLDDIARLLEGVEAEPDLSAVERLREQSSARHRDPTAAERGYADYYEAVKVAFHADAIALTVRTATADALIASGRADPETIAAERQRWFGGADSRRTRPARSGWLAGAFGAATVAGRHASLRSVWFLNSVRGAVALAASVAVADLLNVQHGFWVVLGTLSVLRTNAASTGSTALRALLGTVAGFAIGAALILAVGTSSTALWVTLPLAVLVAAYAPGTAPIAVGQAAFTLVVAVLFNLLVPVGWRVGVVRVENVALGCTVSLLAGALFWPRGAAGVVAEDLADAFRRGSAFLSQAVDWALGFRLVAPDTAVSAVTAGLRLDDGLRVFLAEQGTKHMSKRDLWRLVGGTIRLRLTANSIARCIQRGEDLGPAADVLSRCSGDLVAWYERLAAQLGRPHAGQSLSPLTAPPLLSGKGALETAAFEAPAGRAFPVIFVGEHLHHLDEHVPDLVGPAGEVAELWRRPWWR